MKEIRKGSDITPAKLRALMTKIFQYINEADPTTLNLTTGQVIDSNTTTSMVSDMPSIYSDQYFKSDILINQYVGEDVSFLQKYLDELQSIVDGE